MIEAGVLAPSAAPNPTGNPDKASPAILESVGVVFRVLDELAAARRALGVTELALLLEEPKPRIYRHLASMRQLGVVEQDPITEKYRLGAMLVTYGAAAGEQFDLRTLGDPYLTRLRDACGQSAILSVATHDSALVLSAADSLRSVCITVKPGNRVPAHCSAQGRIVLAFLDEPNRQRVLRRKLQQYTPLSLTNRAQIDERLALIRERLYEESDGEIMEGVSMIAAPIFSGDDKLVGTIGVTGPTSELKVSHDPTVLIEVRTAAADLSARLRCDIYARRGLVRSTGKRNVD